jgi:hypothetical protein
MSPIPVVDQGGGAASATPAGATRTLVPCESGDWCPIGRSVFDNVTCPPALVWSPLPILYQCIFALSAAHLSPSPSSIAPPPSPLALPLQLQGPFLTLPLSLSLPTSSFSSSPSLIPMACPRPCPLSPLPIPPSASLLLCPVLYKQLRGGAIHVQR